MFHHPAVEWAHLQAEAIGLALEVVEITGERELEVEELREFLRELKSKYQLDGLVSGALASEYQRTRIDLICDGTDIRSFAPLWRKNPKRILTDEIEAGFEIIITSCNAMGLTREWLGKTLTSESVGQLESIAAKTGINMAFEGGEAETFVKAGPLFRKRITVRKHESVWAGDSGYLKILEATLE